LPKLFNQRRFFDPNTKEQDGDEQNEHRCQREKGVQHQSAR